MAKHTLIFPGHRLNPEDLLNFSELDWFHQRWNELDLDDETSLTHLQITIMSDPEAGDLVPGTGGLRKLRYVPLGWNVGKRGALRVCYVYFKKYGWVVLVLVYPKGEMDDISPSGRKAVKNAIQRIEKGLGKRFGF